jgi:hypothetical protein
LEYQIIITNDLPKEHQAAPGKISSTTDGWSADTTKVVFLGMTAYWIDVKDAIRGGGIQGCPLGIRA